MAIYSIIFLLNSLSGFVKKNQKKYIIIFVFILLTLLSGTRYYMGGSDVYAYEVYFNNAPDVSIVLKYIFTGINQGVDTSVEPGFILINSIIKSLGFNYFGFTLIISIIFYFFMYNGLKFYVKEWSVVIALFMYKLMFYNTFISIRQGITIAIFFYAIRYIINKELIKYFLICFVAFYIHRASLFLFPIYFVRYIPISKKILFITSIAFLPTIFIRDYVNFENIINNIISTIGFGEKSLGWSESIESVSLIHTFEMYIIIFICIYFYSALEDKIPERRIFLQLLLVLIPIFTLFSNWIIFTRLKDYLVICYAILFQLIITSKKIKNGDLKMYLKCIFLFVCFIGMIRYVYVFDNGALINYESFIFQSKSIFY